MYKSADRRGACQDDQGGDGPDAADFEQRRSIGQNDVRCTLWYQSGEERPVGSFQSQGVPVDGGLPTRNIGDADGEALGNIDVNAKSVGGVSGVADGDDAGLLGASAIRQWKAELSGVGNSGQLQWGARAGLD
jgi:hypothetical protein